MKLIVAGGRDFDKQDIVNFVLNGLHKTYGVSEVVCGFCRGADICGKNWAHSKDIPVKIFPPDYKAYGHTAPLLRNIEMAKYAEGCIVFPGGKGTAHMATQAERHRLQFWDFRQ